MAGSQLVSSLDWASLAPLRVRARKVADGVFAGAHRSTRRGAGVEFGGHRVYVPGDELRFIDVRASMRHERLLVRQFETDTERAVRLVVDATASMGFRSPGASSSKLEFATLLAAALTRVSLTGSDPVGLDWLGGEHTRRVPPSSRADAFDRIVAALEVAKAEGDARQNPHIFDEPFETSLRASRRGSAVVVFSDLLDLPDHAASTFGLRDRAVCVVEILDPQEATFPFEGPVRLRPLERGAKERDAVQTDGPSVRAAYLAALEARANVFQDRLASHGDVLVRCTSSDDPVLVVRNILHALGGTNAAT